MIDLDRFWSEPEDDPGPGVSAADLDAWEQRHGVRLPEWLRAAYRRSDGGSVRFTPFELLPLDQLAPVEDDFWVYEEIPEDEAPDHDLVFRLGYDNEVGGQFLLNYNVRGPEAEPSLYVFHNDGTGASLLDESLTEFFESALTFTDRPMVDWTESKEQAEIVAREGFDITYNDGSRGKLEQVLANSGEALVLYSRLENDLGVELTRLVLPLPLDSDWAGIQSLRPEPSRTFALHLQPVENEGIVCESSKQVEDGRWDNRRSEGVPIYGLFESPDRDRLKVLRDNLFGPHAGERKAEAIRSDPTAVERLAALSPEDRKVATLLAARKKKVELEQQLANPALDPASATLSRHLLDRMDEAIARALAEGAPADPDPETVRRVAAALWPGGG